jgi:hypothetical protein
MRDPLVRWLSAGLILALPILIHVVSATSMSSDLSSSSSRIVADPVGAVVLGLVEVVVAVGLWLAACERRRLGVR